eukprot:gene9193-6470_t
MTASLRFCWSFCLAVVLVLCSTAQWAAAEQGILTTNYYGVLQVPHQFRRSPMAVDPFYDMQPGEVVLTEGQKIFRASVRKDGTFVVRDLPFGTYLMQADFYDFVFPTVLVEVQYKRTETGIRPVIHTTKNDYPVTPLRGAGIDESSPAIIPTAGLVHYFVPREQFSIKALLMNPMVLMLGFGGLTMLMSKMIPEEEKKKSRERNKEMNQTLLNPQEALKNILSGGSTTAAEANRKKKQ